MYLIDTDVLSEARKRSKANRGVRRFFDRLEDEKSPAYISVITVGELRRGVEAIRYRGNGPQAKILESWLDAVLLEFADRVLDFSHDEAQVWGRLRVPHAENAIDKQIAAIALTHDLTLVTRNTAHFEGLGVTLLDPFA